MTVPEGMLIAIIVLVFVFCMIALRGFFREGFFHTRRNIYFALAFGLLFMAYLLYNLVLRRIEPADWVQIFLVLGLVVVTGFYALMAFRQAREMREQRIMTSRPVIIEKAVNEPEKTPKPLGDYFPHFEIYNAGNGPAIEVQVILLNQWKKPHNGQREGFLRAGDMPIKFYTTFPPDVANSTFYIVAEYQGVSSYSPQPIWYQTWLPCKLSITGKVISGKMEFYEVSEEKRVGIFESEFNNGGKPK